jgi:DNA-directed RNA polymerase subunit omega
MVHIASERALGKIGNTFILATLLAQRVKELRQGAKPLVDSDAKNPVHIALLEISQGKITYTLSQDEDE